MDLSVALIKVRDYLFWFGPAYLLALALAGVLEVMLRRRLHLPPRQSAPRREARARPRTPAARPAAPARPTARHGHSGPAAGGLKTSEASGDEPKGDLGPESGLLAEVLWHLAGRPLQWRAPLSLFVWLGVLDRSVTLTALLMTAALNWPLAVLRLGLALVFASVLAVLVPLPVRGASGRSVNVSLAPGPVRPPGSIAGEWWRAVRERLDGTSNALLIGVGLGGAAFGVQKGLLAALGLELAPPLSYLWWALLGAAMPLVPGTELPVLVALQVRGADAGAAAALMLGVTAGGWRLFGALRSRVGLSTAVAYLALASALAALAAWLVAPLIRGAGVF